ncbi:uncharacterized protein LOC101858588 [Aplysia californica]|uniref:Uncharacterized protein LOC101858588 n=1 Tax=Aplysia californica TaxID=6500 RepID=A0ABM0K8V5_APLCA|nr:uncharacterized protein LOC101858588 [Aplysia californica]
MMTESIGGSQESSQLFALGFPVTLSTQEYTKQKLESAVSLLHSQTVSGPVLTEIVSLLLPHVEDEKYSSVWVVLLDKLCGLGHLPETAEVYRQLDEWQDKVFSCDGIPKNVLHRLWLTRLPSLEFAVLKFVDVAASQADISPDNISSLLSRSHLAEISRQEPVAYHVVSAMLERLSREADSSVVANIRDVFHGAVEGATMPVALRHLFDCKMFLGDGADG